MNIFSFLRMSSFLCMVLQNRKVKLTSSFFWEAVSELLEPCFEMGVLPHLKDRGAEVTGWANQGEKITVSLKGGVPECLSLFWGHQGDHSYWGGSWRELGSGQVSGGEAPTEGAGAGTWNVLRPMFRAPLGTKVCPVRLTPWPLESGVGGLACKSPRVDCATQMFGDQNGPPKPF